MRNFSRSARDSERSRAPLNTGNRYDYVLGHGSVIFFEGGRLGQLGGKAQILKEIMDGFGLKLECASTIDLTYFAQEDAIWRARGETHKEFYIQHAAQEYQITEDYVRELSTRDYLYRDEIDARLELADTGGKTTCFECLPGVIRRDHSNKSNKEAFTDIAILLMALPGSVYSDNLLEFLFEYHEDHGRANFRRDWYRVRM